MTKKISFAFVLIIAVPTVFAQTKMQIIKATSKTVYIRDGEGVSKGVWTITPEAKPDIYFTSTKNKTVTFYTDVDSISFNVKPGGIYDFIILLNGKDTALTEIKYVESKLDILKKADKYNLSDNRKFPEFSYQSPSNANLTALRKGFNLDSIAGEGREISKILNLLHWIHNFIPHDGNRENPTVKNAMNMIAVCKRDKRGLNCRGLATVLNECYLSLGIKSKFVTCMPKDSAFDDCHVINSVYSGDLKKWIWIDPTNNAYVMNEKGELLSIEEVRERLINDNPLILNPDANWNNKSLVRKEEYLYNYMAKNLYRIESPLVSEYDYETRKNGKTIRYIELLPLNTYNETPQKKQWANQQTGTTFINYKTNNSKTFWAVPQ